MPLAALDDEQQVEMNPRPFDPRVDDAPHHARIHVPPCTFAFDIGFHTRQFGLEISAATLRLSCHSSCSTLRKMLLSSPASVQTLRSPDCIASVTSQCGGTAAGVRVAVGRVSPQASFAFLLGGHKLPLLRLHPRRHIRFR